MKEALMNEKILFRTAMIILSFALAVTSLNIVMKIIAGTTQDLWIYVITVIMLVIAMGTSIWSNNNKVGS